MKAENVKKLNEYANNLVLACTELARRENDVMEAERKLASLKRELKITSGAVDAMRVEMDKLIAEPAQGVELARY